MNKIDIALPTMWKVPEIYERIEQYLACPAINKIIIIDNDKKDRRKLPMFDHEKIELVSYGRNIYVNPAWNEGYYRSKADIVCLLSDDVEVDNGLFEDIAKLDFTNIDIIGMRLVCGKDNYHIGEHPDNKEELIRLNYNRTLPIGGQAYAFGVCMFVKRTSYKVIPSLYKIWFGDDYLVQHNQNVYVLKTNRVKGEISKTIVIETKKKNSDLQARMDLDCLNGYKYNHFLNGKNWDLFKNSYAKHTQKKLL